METNVHYTVVGAFVLVLLGIILVTIVWLSSGFSLQRYNTYKVYMKESVSGLNIDSPVEYNGVNVGTVKNIQINHKNPQLVELLLSVKSDTPITQGTRAKLDLRSLSGLTFMALVDKGIDMTPLVAQPGQAYPVIYTIPSILVRLDTTLTQLNSSFREISNSFQQISLSVQTLFDKQNLQSIKQILVNIDKASVQLIPLLKSGHSSMQEIETQTLPAANQALINMDKIADDLSDLSVEIKQNPALLIRGKAPQAPGPGE